MSKLLSTIAFVDLSLQSSHRSRGALTGRGNDGGKASLRTERVLNKFLKMTWIEFQINTFDGLTGSGVIKSLFHGGRTLTAKQTKRKSLEEIELILPGLIKFFACCFCRSRSLA